MTAAFSETAYAKINLALHVRAREPSGYHQLETIFAFAADGDVLTATPSETLSLTVSGPFASPLLEGEDNLVWRAAVALREVFGCPQGAALTLDKRLPIASGIGGGSADAGAALRLLARLWALPVDEARMHAIASGLGADVLACYLSETTRGSGRGDVLEPISGLRGIPILLVNPGVPVSTAAVFAGWGRVDLGALSDASPIEAALAGRNDLEAPAIAIAPVIRDVTRLLDGQPGVRLARMSGSGATCFALCEDIAARDRLGQLVAERQPGWWRLKSVLR